MRPVLTLDELRELRTITQGCAKHAALARKEMARYADHYRLQAEEYERQAARARLPELRASLLRIAASHARLAQLAAGREAPRQWLFDVTDGTKPPADEQEDATSIGGTEKGLMKGGLIEGSLAQARRHVTAAERMVAKQGALVARLSEDPRYAVLAAEAREVLGTLKQTLALSRDHLEIELSK